jgi:dTDP-4-amino-4,6-dideoxygalactose transaminase
MIPPVVLNAIINSGNSIRFVDNTRWVGDSYTLHEFKNYKIIDSAQKVEKNQFCNEAEDEDLMIFSFYPTKPVGSLDGGIIVSNDYEKIRYFKEASLNGMSYSLNNWDRKIKFPGWKMYMSSFQSFIAMKNLEKLEEKLYNLSIARDFYNYELGYNNTSDHLYRINVKNREKFSNIMKENNISTGIHYYGMHRNPVYKKAMKNNSEEIFLNTDSAEKTTISIPFNERLTEKEICFIVEIIKKSGYLINESQF